MNPAQQKLWDAIDSDDPVAALPMLQQAIAEGATVDVMRKKDLSTPLAALLTSPAGGKAPLVRVLLQGGGNPLRDGGLRNALINGDLEICQAVVDACVQNNYTAQKGEGLLETLILNAPPMPRLAPSVAYALQQGADRTRPPGASWLHVLLENQPLFANELALERNAQVGWDICEALLDAGMDPDEPDQHGVCPADLVRQLLQEGCPPPRNTHIIPRLLGARLERDTPQVSQRPRRARL